MLTDIPIVAKTLLVIIIQLTDGGILYFETDKFFGQVTKEFAAEICVSRRNAIREAWVDNSNGILLKAECE